MKNIIFFVRHFTERGTETSIFNYAKYNEEILNNKSYIVAFTENKIRKLGWDIFGRLSYDKFKNRFTVIEIDEIKDITNVIDELNIDYFYTQTGGDNDVYEFENKSIWKNCKTIKHCVFNTRVPESDYYISISNCINNNCGTSYPVLPLLVDLPKVEGDLRNELNIPKDAIVIGRYGGYYEFNISFVYQCIFNILQKNNNIYFLFMNTKPFGEHPRIIYLNPSTDLNYKSLFVNSCSAMIHARSMGETFGMAVGEFSLMNKPIITSNSGDNEHILILKDKANIYNSPDELNYIFENIATIISSRNDWNAYKDYNPYTIMELFNKLLLSS
jgi:hypothetical protein